MLDPGGQRPVAVAELPAQLVEVAVQVQQQRVAKAAEKRYPPAIAGDDVELVAMHHQQSLAAAGFVLGPVYDRDAAQCGAGIAPQELVMIAGHVRQPCAVSDHGQELPHDVGVRLRPVESRSQAPAVDDVADQVQFVAGVGLQEREQTICLTSSGAEMDVREKYRPEVGLACRFEVDPVHEHWLRWVNVRAP